MASPPVAAPILILGRGRGGGRGRAASMGGYDVASRAEPSRVERGMREETRAAIFLPLLFLHLFSRNIELEAEKFRREFFSNFPPGFNIGRKQAALTLFPAIFHIAPDSISNSKSPRIKKYPSSTLPSFLIPLYYALESFLPRKKKKKKFRLPSLCSIRDQKKHWTLCRSGSRLILKTVILCRFIVYEQFRRTTTHVYYANASPFFSKGREGEASNNSSPSSKSNVVYYREMELLLSMTRVTRGAK